MNYNRIASADPEGGPGVRTPPPPWDLSEAGSCVEVWWVGEGVPRLCLPYYYHFFLARFARQYYTNILHVYILQSSIWHGTVILFYISLIQRIKRTNCPSLTVMKRYFPILFLSSLTRFYTIQAENFLGEHPQTPLPDTFTMSKLPCHPCVLCKEACNCTKDHSLPKINYCPKINLNSWI